MTIGHMHVSTGRKYHPLDPRADEIFIEDIAHHLANKCRYAGAVQHPSRRRRMFYSVAEHSVYVSRHGDSYQREKLMHDAAEAYIGDLIRPLKRSIKFSAPFQYVERMNEAVIAERFGLTYPFPPDVKAADEAITAAEITQIVPSNSSWTRDELAYYHDNSHVAGVEIACWSPYVAKHVFLSRFYELFKALDDAVPFAYRHAHGR